jgi:hypothetical protein
LEERGNPGTAKLSSRSSVSCCTNEVKDYKQNTEIAWHDIHPNKQIDMLNNR